MNKLYTLILLFFSTVIVAQTTWVQRLSFTDSSPYNHPEDSLTGVKNIVSGADENLFVIATIRPSNYQTLFKINPSSPKVLWSIQVGYHSSLTGSYSMNVFPTRDSGCVVAENYFGEISDSHIYGFIQKYSKDGVLEWQYTSSLIYYYYNTAYDVIQTKDGNYIALIGDSIHKIDKSGNLISKSDTLSGTRIFEIQSGQFLIQRLNDTLKYTDLSGNVFWSLPSTKLLSYYGGFAFILSGNIIRKVDLSNGSIAWSYPAAAISSLDAIIDGGFIASIGEVPGDITSAGGKHEPGVLFRVDKNGSLVWSKSYGFPYFGLSCVKQHSSGNIITGGAYTFLNEHVSYYYPRDHSAFLASVDSSGKGRLENTSTIWTHDANNNGFVSFVDDGLYPIVAMGTIGYPRDTIDGGDYSNEWLYGRGDYAWDWPQSFCNGINYKNADANGDGILDSVDMTLGYPYHRPNPWRKADHIDGIPDFKFVPEKTTLTTSDTLVRFYMIAGSNSIPIDSIAGIAFSVYSDTATVFSTSYSVVDSSVFNNKFGVIGNEVFTYSYWAADSGGYRGNNRAAMDCRKDHKNVYGLNDTVGYVRVHIRNWPSTPQYLKIFIDEFKALTACGADVSLNLSSDSVFMPSSVGIAEANKLEVRIFPNPATTSVRINTDNLDLKQVVVYDETGRQLKTVSFYGTDFSLNINDLNKGFYLLDVQCGDDSKKLPLIVQ